MKKCNILCGGVVEDIAQTAARIDKEAYTICADSGYAYAAKLGLRADAVLGDFDSYALEQVQEKNVTVFPARKDYTDSEIAVMYALEQGYTDITLIGALGGRIDHALGNVHLLRYIAQAGVQGSIVDGATQMWYETKGRCVQGKPGDILSVIPLSQNGSYTTRGLEYALTAQPMPLTGISNVFTAYEAEITAQNATFLLIHIIQ
ncbi:MAG: thiamine diphosphokinase [Clostridia bacterium]|nr:thiamine diphosphokinase [Clostridia bacterium]